MKFFKQIILGTALTMASPLNQPMTSDKYSIMALEVVRTGAEAESHSHKISFDVWDWSTSPFQTTHCELEWSGHHLRRGPVKCANPWITASMSYFDDLTNFAVSITHAYGEDCVDCNNDKDEDYTGDASSCEFMVTDDRMSKVKMHGEGGATTSANKEIYCNADFDD